MLKISIDVKSGIKEFVVPKNIKDSYIDKFKLEHNSKNRQLFLQGILLFLMGERISLHSLSRNDPDPNWQAQCQVLKNFLSKVELKGKIIESCSNLDTMAFSQHRKHGVPIYAGYKIDRNELKEVRIDNSRLNPKYAPFVKAGLFDAFELPESDLVTLLKNSDWEASKRLVNHAVSNILNDSCSFDDKGILTLDAAKNLAQSLKKIFSKLVLLKPHNKKNDYTYQNVLSFFISNDKELSFLNLPKSGFKLDKEKRTEKQQTAIAKVLITLEKLTINQIRFSYFMWRYLEMYVVLYESEGKKPKCTSFGIASLDYKNRKGLQALMDWFSDPLKAFKMPNKNAHAAFYQGIFSASKNGVSYRAPVKTIRYDGVFELFVKTDPSTEALIKKQIANSGRWYLRIGKLCLGSLLEAPLEIDSNIWDQIIDDG